MRFEEPNELRQIWVKRNCGDKAICEPTWNWSPPTLSDYDLWYVLSGKGQLTLNGKVFSVQHGSCFIIRPGDNVTASQDADDRLTLIYIHFHLFDIFTGQPISSTSDALPPRHNFVKDVYLIESYLNRMLEFDGDDDIYSQEQFNCLMKLVLIYLCSQHAKTTEVSSVSHKNKQSLRKIMQYIKDNITSRIEHDELASLVDLSPRYLNRIFKQYTGTSLKEFMTRTRLERAVHLLTETSMNVEQVAETLGYSDIYFFSKQFKQHYGTPPSHYRSKIKAPIPHYF